MKVSEDMGLYQNLVLGKSPQSIKGKKDEVESYKASMEKVKTYVEDLTVMRESLLKIEFRNIELEEVNAKREREIDELR